MGAWGAGIFENDGALDFAGDVTKEFIARIETAITSADFDVDRQGARVVLPCVAFLTLLGERANAVPPRLAQVATWRARYLARYDAAYEPDGASAFAAFHRDRRVVAETAFHELEARAQAFWREGVENKPPPAP